MMVYAQSQAELRQLAANGQLHVAHRNADPDQRRQLWGTAYEIVSPLVFQQSTVRLERLRGHMGCGSSIGALQPECLDRHHDNVETMIDHLFSMVTDKQRIENIEGWLTSRMNAALIDAHRRRRGARGALQRPRAPRWLIEGLDDDRWLVHLAVQILTWVGVPDTAGIELWPIDTWAAQHAKIMKTDYRYGNRAVRADIDRVLAVMRTRPQWYADYIERPLGKKVMGSMVSLDAVSLDVMPQLDTAMDETMDARLTQLAEHAIEAIKKRLANGEPPYSIVREVLQYVFEGNPIADDLENVGRQPVDLGDALRDPRHYAEIVIKIGDIINDYAALQDAEPVHRDIKPSNILLFGVPASDRSSERDSPALTVALSRGVVSRWYEAASTHVSGRRTHWLTKKIYYTAMQQVLDMDMDRPSWRDVVAAVRPAGSRNTFYQVIGPHARDSMTGALIDDGHPPALALAACYKRDDAVARLIDETKVWSYWPYRQSMLTRIDKTPPTGVEKAIIDTMARWESENPKIAAALGYTPPACAVEDLVIARPGWMDADEARDVLTEKLRRWAVKTTRTDRCNHRAELGDSTE